MQYPDYISHHGIKGQKWGVRRYQNPDGTYTAQGKQRRKTTKNKIQDEKDFRKAFSTIDKNGYFDSYGAKETKDIKRIAKESKSFEEFDDKVILKYGDHIGDVLYDEIESIRYNRRKTQNTMKHYDYISHHGIKGQKWGVRRYQNSDGTYTAVYKTTSRIYKKNR